MNNYIQKITYLVKIIIFESKYLIYHVFEVVEFKYDNKNSEYKMADIIRQTFIEKVLFVRIKM